MGGHEYKSEWVKAVTPELIEETINKLISMSMMDDHRSELIEKVKNTKYLYCFESEMWGVNHGNNLRYNDSVSVCIILNSGVNNDIMYLALNSTTVKLTLTDAIMNSDSRSIIHYCNRLIDYILTQYECIFDKKILREQIIVLLDYLTKSNNLFCRAIQEQYKFDVLKVLDEVYFI